MAVLAIFLVVGTIAGALLTWLIRNTANRYGLAFGPSSNRHVHRSPIPRLGGVAIFLSFVGLFGIYLLAGSLGWIRRPARLDVLKVLLPASGLFWVGLLDDLRGVRPWTKLAAQIAGGIALFSSGIHFACFQWPGALPWLNSGICLLMTVFWVVLICNAINLIDGLDGLASGAALFSMVTIFTVALVEGRYNVATATLILGGSMAGFLIFNFSPASIFLGDSGSQFVGFMLSGFVLAEAQKQSIIDSFAIPIISLALPLTDTGLSVLRRFLSGHSLFGADKEHIHHKLLELGLTQRQVVWILYGFSAACAVLSLILLQPSHLMAIPVIGVLLLLIFYGVRKLGYHELAEFHRVWKRVGQQKQVFARDIALRKASTELRKLDDFERVLDLMEDCLQHDFDGFDLVVHPPDDTDESLDRSGVGPIQRVWKNGYEEKVLFTLELNTPERGLIGSLTLHRQSGAGWLVDTDLLAGELQKSLGIALDNCLSSDAQRFPLPSLEAATETATFGD